MIRINPKSGGWLEVVCGPMFSGKSEEMIRRLRRAEIAGQQVVICAGQELLLSTVRGGVAQLVRAAES